MSRLQEKNIFLCKYISEKRNLAGIERRTYLQSITID